MKSLLALVIIFFWFANLGCNFEPPPEGMVLVSSGYFQMGTNRADEDNQALSAGLKKPWFADETPERRIKLGSFYIDKFEVTNRQYYIYSQATDRPPPKPWQAMKYPEGQDDFPVTGVSFFDAAAYAEWAGKRLPTEEEWEKAARGEKGLIYPWGDRFDIEKANVSPSVRMKSGKGMKPVGSFPEGASPYGVHDMIGNAWEWVWDYYLPYPESKHKSKDYEKKLVVVRGLSFLSVGHFPKNEYRKVIALKARASFREKLSPLSRKIDVGFRCAKSRPTVWQQLFSSGKDKEKEKIIDVL